MHPVLYYPFVKMSKTRFQRDYEFQIPPKVLFELVSEPNNLKLWFCDEIIIHNDREMNLVWDDLDHESKITLLKPPKAIRFEFVDEDAPADPSFIEFGINQTSITKSIFFTVIDYSKMSDEQEWNNLWDALIDQLRKLIGR